MSGQQPILPANHLFRGVPVPAGAHRVRFEYRTGSLAAAAGASLLAWLAIGLWVLRARRYAPARRQRLTV